MSSPVTSNSQLATASTTDQEVLVKVEGVSKKFCRSLKRSLWYGVCDIAGELNPFARHAAGGTRPSACRCEICSCARSYRAFGPANERQNMKLTIDKEADALYPAVVSL